MLFESLFPGVAHNISAADEVSISKLGGGGVITYDNCNGAMKVKRLLVRAVQEAVAAEAREEGGGWANLPEEEKKARALVLEVDGWNHLRNVWLGNVTASSLSGSPARSFARRAGRSRLLAARGCWDRVAIARSREWVERCHPRALLLHVERTKGSRQDLAFEGAGAVYMNCAFWVEFLDERIVELIASVCVQLHHSHGNKNAAALARGELAHAC
eukprot:4495606-Pleurochrysis_carterae.AAC.2